MTDLGLAGQAYLVTGGSRGLGRACAFGRLDGMLRLVRELVPVDVGAMRAL